MAVASAGPYASLHLAQIDNHASTPSLKFFYRPDLRPTNSVKALKAYIKTMNILFSPKK